MPSLRGVAGRIARAIPSIDLEIKIPQRPEAMAKRDHNKVVKDALKNVILFHHRENIPRHFERSAHGRYGYAQRSQKYIREKNRRYGSSTDLVKTGRSRQRMLSDPKVTIGGAAEGGKKPIEGTLKLRFDFTGGGGRRYLKKGTRQAVQIEQMHKEIRAITRDELRELAKKFRSEYMTFYTAASYQAVGYMIPLS